MKLDEEKLYDYLKEANEAIVFLLAENQKHTKVLGALCDVIKDQIKINQIIKTRLDDISKGGEA